LFKQDSLPSGFPCCHPIGSVGALIETNGRPIFEIAVDQLFKKYYFRKHMSLGVGIAEQNSFVTLLNTALVFSSCASINKELF